MIYNNFSEKYKKVLISGENRIKEIGFKELKTEDIFLEIMREAENGIKDIFNLYGINEKLILEIIQKGSFNEKIEERKWVYSGMSNKVKEIILGSVKIAASYGKEKADIEDFILSMVKQDIWLANVLDYIGINPRDFETNFQDLNQMYMNTRDSLQNDAKTLEEWMDKLIWAITENFLWGMWGEIEDSTPFSVNGSTDEKKEKKDSNTPALDFFSNDLTEEAKAGKLDKVIGREQEIERLIAILNRKTKNNPVLVGEPWVGKTAIVEWLAARIASGDVPFSMKEKRILALDMSGLVAGTKYRWEFETRIKQVVEEASKIENEVILFIDEIHTIIGAWSSEGTLDASNILKPAMGRGKIRVIGATTLWEYQKYIEKDPALERRFQRIVAAEPTREIAIEIISGLRETFENYHNLNITNEAVEEAVNLSIRYITDRFLPDKAIDLIDEACSLKSMKYNIDEEEITRLREKVVEFQKKIETAVISQQYKKASSLKIEQKSVEEKISDLKKKFSIPKNKRLSVGKEDIQKVLSISTWIPSSNLSKTEIDKLKKLSKTLSNKIIGQDDAIEQVVKSIMRSQAGIGNPNRPLASFLFLWPTGVWKTELVKVLAREFYGDESALIKVDMSEYSDKTSVNKLIGSSAGYVGYEEGGQLTEKVRKKPYSIILFDEIEKWDFEVYNLLLQILEEWILTDNKGRKINFKNTIIVMTSNVWQEEFSEKARQIGFDTNSTEEEKVMKDFQKAKEKIIGNLTDYFSPEFINRIDKILVFNPLDKTIIKNIVKLQIEELIERLSRKGFILSYSTTVLNTIAKKVYNPEFWAREIRRFIVDTIEDGIASIIVNQKEERKDFTISTKKDEIIVS
jgi:ATP-dependent Clp protease ATP-binding subunit ClpC